jgi:hypothetical protein
MRQRHLVFPSTNNRLQRVCLVSSWIEMIAKSAEMYLLGFRDRIGSEEAGCPVSSNEIVVSLIL